ncbi:TPA: helix-turn-helix transcriptional regulator [Staphylococcus aureus]|uniref:helix-turn-helix transcriptional regulator n=1 Tax=Staphylococcus aureus TaxID=1280 RepID=UPI002026F295|nr:helix-turn-helix transcriptional regulator [Staphylococcus aureus]MCL9744841.1 helix-turn-helix domain-containing protein [Staphylococcus aureus]HDS2063156.1 helix-turn-helix transcriptional regulator [Staphylococcus aureus]
MKLAEAIKEQRELKRWSQEELANILKVSRQSVSKWESAKNYPSLDILIAMSDLFGISLEHLIKGDAHFKKVILEGNYRESNRAPSIVDFLYDFWWLFFPVAGFLVWAIHSFMG